MNKMKTKKLIIIAVAVTALIVVTSATAYANVFTPRAYQYTNNRYASIGQPGFGMGGMMGGGMMQGYDREHYGGAPSQDTPRFYGGPGMMGSMMGGMIGEYGWAGDSEQGGGMPCLEGWDYNGDATQSEYAPVIIGDYAFHPPTLTVTVGTTVTWINMDFVGHNVEAGTHNEDGQNHEERLFESPLLGHMQSFRYTFTEPGEYVYHCDPHPDMEGKIVVVAQ